MFDRIKDLICEKLNVSPNEIKLETSFKNDLDADSLDLAELVMAFEEEFNIEITDEQVENIVTVGDVVDYIKNLTE